MRRGQGEGAPCSERLSTNSSHFQSHQQLPKKERLDRPTSPLRNHHRDIFDSRKNSEPKAQKRQERSRPSTAGGKQAAKSRMKSLNSEAKPVPPSASKSNSVSKGASFSRDQTDQ